MYLKLFICALFMLLCSRHSAAQDDLTHSYKCNFAKVKLPPRQKASIPVRTEGGRSFRQIDKLRAGQEVYICNENREWFKIFYNRNDGPCHSTSENGLDVHKTKGCQSGWVEKKWIDVISG